MSQLQAACASVISSYNLKSLLMLKKLWPLVGSETLASLLPFRAVVTQPEIAAAGKGFPSRNGTCHSAQESPPRAPNSLTSQLHLPRNLAAKPAGMAGMTFGGTLQRLPRRTVSVVHLGEGKDRCWIRPVGRNPERHVLLQNAHYLMTRYMWKKACILQ